MTRAFLQVEYSTFQKLQKTEGFPALITYSFNFHVLKVVKHINSNIEGLIFQIFSSSASINCTLKAICLCLQALTKLISYSTQSRVAQLKIRSEKSSLFLSTKTKNEHSKDKLLSITFSPIKWWEEKKKSYLCTPF